MVNFNRNPPNELPIMDPSNASQTVPFPFSKCPREFLTSNPRKFQNVQRSGRLEETPFPFNLLASIPADNNAMIDSSSFFGSSSTLMTSDQRPLPPSETLRRKHWLETVSSSSPKTVTNMNADFFVPGLPATPNTDQPSLIRAVDLKASLCMHSSLPQQKTTLHTSMSMLPDNGSRNINRSAHDLRIFESETSLRDLLLHGKSNLDHQSSNLNGEGFSTYRMPYEVGIHDSMNESLKWQDFTLGNALHKTSERSHEQFSAHMPENQRQKQECKAEASNIQSTWSTDGLDPSFQELGLSVHNTNHSVSESLIGLHGTDGRSATISFGQAAIVVDTALAQPHPDVKGYATDDKRISSTTLKHFDHSELGVNEGAFVSTEPSWISGNDCVQSKRKSSSRHPLGPALNTNFKPRARQGSANDPQSIAARHRRERINTRLKALQELVPNGSKVDLVTMLEKAINYVKFLQLQLKVLTNDEYWRNPPRLKEDSTVDCKDIEKRDSPSSTVAARSNRS